MSLYDYSGQELDVGGASFIVNVKDYGATGDGTTDDASAIQSALDSVKNSGGTIVFPAGTYSVQSSIRFYSNQHLIFDRSAVLQSGSSSVDGLLIGYVDSSATGYNGLENVIIEGGTFSRGSSSKITLLGVSHARNILIKNATFNSTVTWHNVEISSAHNCIIDNCVFSGSEKSGDTSEVLQLDRLYASTDYPWDNVGSLDGTSCDGVIIKDCLFKDNSVCPFVGSHSISGKNVRIHDCTFENNTSTKGAIWFSTLANLDVYDNTFTGCTNGVTFGTSGYDSCAVHDNRFINATTPIASNITVQYNNWINGSFTQ